jgi:hypothetical protein
MRKHLEQRLATSTALLKTERTEYAGGARVRVCAVRRAVAERRCAHRVTSVSQRDAELAQAQGVVQQYVGGVRIDARRHLTRMCRWHAWAQRQVEQFDPAAAAMTDAQMRAFLAARLGALPVWMYGAGGCACVWARV